VGFVCELGGLQQRINGGPAMANVALGIEDFICKLNVCPKQCPFRVPMSFDTQKTIMAFRSMNEVLMVCLVGACFGSFVIVTITKRKVAQPYKYIDINIKDTERIHTSVATTITAAAHVPPT
jgi:hypothetical protein